MLFAMCGTCGCGYGGIGGWAAYGLCPGIPARPYPKPSAAWFRARLGLDGISTLISLWLTSGLSRLYSSRAFSAAAFTWFKRVIDITISHGRTDLGSMSCLNWFPERACLVATRSCSRRSARDILLEPVR